VSGVCRRCLVGGGGGEEEAPLGARTGGLAHAEEGALDRAA